RAQPLAELAQTIGAFAVVGDTCSATDCEQVLAKTIDKFGKVDVVIANAGVMSLGSTTELDVSEWEETLSINVTGAMQICRAALPFMIQSCSGAIITVSSVAGLATMSDTAAYVTSKHALQGYTKTLAIDYGRYGIRANALAPGWVRTPMSDDEMQQLADRRGITFDEAVAMTVAHLPLARMAQPGEIAACAEFLASDDASFVTGATLVADGGGNVVDVGAIAL
ncbi:MAG: SDR family oxidoreductase, partial [Gammaproteobacteria bacterium]|nr:SDR family oxidoreductase [Gammaproteobacteria bacterium]